LFTMVVCSAIRLSGLVDRTGWGGCWEVYALRGWPPTLAPPSPGS
jgi:hypothetical protein